MSTFGSGIMGLGRNFEPESPLPSILFLRLMSYGIAELSTRDVHLQLLASEGQ